MLNRVGFLPVLDITEIQQGGLQTKVWLASDFRIPDICLEENPQVSFQISGVSLDLQENLQIKNEEQVEEGTLTFHETQALVEALLFQQRALLPKKGSSDLPCICKVGFSTETSKQSILCFSRLDSWMDSELAACTAEPYPLLIKFLQ